MLPLRYATNAQRVANRDSLIPMFASMFASCSRSDVIPVHDCSLALRQCCWLCCLVVPLKFMMYDALCVITTAAGSGRRSSVLGQHSATGTSRTTGADCAAVSVMWLVAPNSASDAWGVLHARARCCIDAWCSKCSTLLSAPSSCQVSLASPRQAGGVVLVVCVMTATPGAPRFPQVCQ